MKAVLLVGVGLLLATGGAVETTRGLAQEPAQVTSQDPPPTTPWFVGERLEYNVKFSLFTVGRAYLQVMGIDTIRGVPSWHVMFVVRGHALGYTLRDSLQSWFGVRDLSSRRFIQDTDEDGRMRYRHFEIFPERQQWTRDTLTGETPANPLDDASFFFYARTLPFVLGQTITMDRYFIRDRNPVTLQILQRQTISVPAGRFRTMAVRPVFKTKGLFAQGGGAIIWFSDDEARIPVRIRTSLSVGTLDISLRAYNQP
jgi:hypothetical protein